MILGEGGRISILRKKHFKKEIFVYLQLIASIKNARQCYPGHFFVFKSEESHDVFIPHHPEPELVLLMTRNET
jgi:hypothetical protein